MFEQDDKKNAETVHNKELCECTSSHGLYVKNRQLSLAVAGVILLNFCLFMGGYFLGQKNAVSDFSDKIEQESFSDQIYSSMCSLCDSGEVEEDSDNEEEVAENDEQASLTGEEESATVLHVSNAQETNIADETKASPFAIVATDTNSDSQQADQNAQEANIAETQFYAQLIGFGSARTAQQFAQKLSRKEVPVVVKKRQSRSARGRFVSWYQVVTEKFNDRQELEALIARLEREEKITGVQIATC